MDESAEAQRGRTRTASRLGRRLESMARENAVSDDAAGALIGRVLLIAAVAVFGAVVTWLGW